MKYNFIINKQTKEKLLDRILFRNIRKIPKYKGKVWYCLEDVFEQLEYRYINEAIRRHPVGDEHILRDCIVGDGMIYVKDKTDRPNKLHFITGIGLDELLRKLRKESAQNYVDFLRLSSVEDDKNKATKGFESQLLTYLQTYVAFIYFYNSRHKTRKQKQKAELEAKELFAYNKIEGTTFEQYFFPCWGLNLYYKKHNVEIEPEDGKSYIVIDRGNEAAGLHILKSFFEQDSFVR